MEFKIMEQEQKNEYTFNKDYYLNNALSEIEGVLSGDASNMNKYVQIKTIMHNTDNNMTDVINDLVTSKTD